MRRVEWGEPIVGKLVIGASPQRGEARLNRMADIYAEVGVSSKRSAAQLFDPEILSTVGDESFLLEGVQLEVWRDQNNRMEVAEHSQLWLVTPLVG